MPDDASDYLRRPDARGHLKVMEVLRRWDPIGVIDEANQDEYDGYSAGFVRRLDAGASVEDLVEHMRRIVTQAMEIRFDEAHSRDCATEMVELLAVVAGPVEPAAFVSRIRSPHVCPIETPTEELNHEVTKGTKRCPSRRAA